MTQFLLYAVAVLAGVLLGVGALSAVIVFALVPAISRPGRPPKSPTPRDQP